MSRPSDSTAPLIERTPTIAVETSQPLPLREPLLGRHLDSPTPGPLGQLVIMGWVLCAEGPCECVLGTASDTPALHVAADRSRPDIAAAFPDLPHAERSGFRLLIPTAVVKHVDQIVVSAVLPGGRLIPIWRLGIGRAQPAGEPAELERPPRRRWTRSRASSTPSPSSPAAPALTPPPAPVLPAGLAPWLAAISAQASEADPAPAAVRPTTQSEGPIRVVAIISTFNEADIIAPVLDHLASNGIWSYLIDNDSTDDTVRRAQPWLGRGLLGIERFATGGDGRTSWRALLTRKLELSRELGADWYIHHDADEIRESPWPGISLREAIHWVDRLGFSAIDFRVLNFVAVDDSYRDGDDPRQHFRRWEDPAEYDRIQRKCWKADAADVSLADGGHDVRFADRRLFPLRFLLRHYPIRSQAHGRRKVFEHRKGRFSEDELRQGWHRQYDHFTDPDQLFLRNPASLRLFDLERVRLETMLEDGRIDARAAESGHNEDNGARPGAEGFLERVSPTTISGWAAPDHRNAEPAIVEVWDGARKVATVRADQHRADLAEKGIGDGRSGFTLATPRELLDGQPHWIWATVAGTEFALRRSPLVLHAAGRISLASPGASKQATGGSKDPLKRA